MLSKSNALEQQSMYKSVAVDSHPQSWIKVLCEQTRELTHDFLDYV